MKHKNSIVRTKTIHKTENGTYYEIELMTFEKYLIRSGYVFIDTEFDLYPYKWYDLRYLVDYLYYFLFISFSNPNKKHLKINDTRSIIIRVLLFLTEVIVSGFITEIIF